MVPVADVRLERRLERFEVVPAPPPEELVLHVAEDLLGRAVVDAVAFGLCEAVLCGFVLDGASAAYLMITLFTLLSLVEAGIYVSRQ